MMHVLICTQTEHNFVKNLNCCKGCIQEKFRKSKEMHPRHLVVLFPFFFLMGLCSEVSSREYERLVDGAHLLSFSYCLKRGLKEGYLADDETHCETKACKSEEYGHILVLKTFNYEGWGTLGSGYYALDDKHQRILLVFRGTASNSDWFSNVNAVPVKYDPMVNSESLKKRKTKLIKCEGCLVHRGFYNFLKNICAEIVLEVLMIKDKYPDYQLVVSGHSLGAALTLLSGIELQLMGYDPLVISYGGPKIGNKKMMAFVDRIFQTSKTTSQIQNEHDFHKGFVRVVHKGDLIPRLPPGKVYHHAGYQYYIWKKKLPHLSSDITKKGLKWFELEDEDLSDKGEAALSPGSFWPSNFKKYEHVHYFLRVTGCRNKEE